MAKLTATQRKKLGPGEFALPGRRFPINDKVHAEKALQLAPRSEKAGNISPAEEHEVQDEARAKLKAMGPAKRSPKVNRGSVI